MSELAKYWFVTVEVSGDPPDTDLIWDTLEPLGFKIEGMSRVPGRECSGCKAWTTGDRCGICRFVDESRTIPSRTTDPDTSHKAATAVTVRAGTQRAKLLRVFAIVGEEGRALTDEQAMNLSAVSPSSEYSKRCSELREAGLIEPTGETRTGASGHQRLVSRITEAGRKVVQGL